MADLEALDGEGWVALDELPPEAELATVLDIIATVHAEGVAAIMAEHPTGLPALGRRLDYEARPRNGPATLEDQ